MIPKIVYLLCGLTSMLCAALLFRRYRSTRASLLFWSTLCFVFLALSNVLLYVDLVVLPEKDLSPLRALINLTAMTTLLYGLIRERT